MAYIPTIPIPTCRVSKLDFSRLIEYREKHAVDVRKRLEEFKEVGKAGLERVFHELCFCVLTPQSSGFICDNVVAGLAQKDVLKDPLSRKAELEESLKRTRFWRNKTRYILKARERFFDESHGGRPFFDQLCSMAKDCGDPRDMRNWVRGELKGMGIGLKEASHFLRNTGVTFDVAIVDRHVIKCLCDLGVLETSINGQGASRKYFEIEDAMIDFSSKAGIPLGELDLLFWSSKTGFIFK